jgi:uncharacterized membrane protein
MANKPPDRVSDHLAKMRRIWAMFLATVPVAIMSGFLLPRLTTDAASPVMVTLLLVAGCLWVSFTAERDARTRLERAKRAFAARGDSEQLLSDHRTVFWVVMVRLEIVVVCSVVASVWGLGPSVGVWMALLGGMMMGLAWPSERKTRLLIERARILKGE